MYQVINMEGDKCGHSHRTLSGALLCQRWKLLDGWEAAVVIKKGRIICNTMKEFEEVNC